MIRGGSRQAGRRRRAKAAAGLLALLSAGAVGGGTRAAAQSHPYQFQANSQLVMEAVTVTGADGAPIAGLTASDFVVLENGVPQRLAICEYQQFSAAGAPPRASALPPSAAAAPGITPESAAGDYYRNRRLLVLYFDLTSMSVSDQLRSLQAAQKYITTEMQPSDLVAILAYEGTAVEVKQDFTADRGRLEHAIAKLVYEDVLGYDENPNDAATPDTGSAWGQDDSEFFIFNTNRQLSALQTAVQMLAPISEKKSLVYFASGLPLNGLDNQAQLAATEAAALRANVALFPVDARGLAAAPPLGDATQGSPGGLAMYNGAAAEALAGRRVRSQDTLYALAADTGGRAFFNNNDLSAGIVRAERAIANYYLLGYYSSDAARDGRYRRVQIRLRGHPGARLAYRPGYYAAKAFRKFTAADKERQLLDALLLPDPITDLTIDLEVNYFELDSAEYFVPIAAKIPGSELALAKAGGAEKAQIDFIGEIKDPFGNTIANLRDKIAFKLDRSSAAQLAKSPIEYTAGFTLLPGAYAIKLLARDDATGHIGTYLAHFTIPNLAQSSPVLALSSVVLASQRVPFTAALYNVKAAKNERQQAANPLVYGGGELLPSVTRVFSRTQTLQVFAQAYERGAKTAEPLIAYFGFYRGLEARRLVLETPTITVAAPLRPPAYALPIRLSVPLGNLAPGPYTCQLSVLDPAGHKAAFWRAPLWIIP
ncbi:MAG TPA: VWA domain-containing protein [Terriglobales bacterium]|nr:VWA domain-containing protein [Terriglobales bacterium]